MTTLDIENLLSQLQNPLSRDFTVETSFSDKLYLDNLEQPIWPIIDTHQETANTEISLNKRQLLSYYAQVLNNIFPYIQGQGCSPLLYPNGVDRDFFFAMFYPQRLPSFIHINIDTDKNQSQVLLNNPETLFYLLNAGAITFQCPIRQALIFQIYGPKTTTSFKTLSSLALKLKQELDAQQLQSYLKTFQFERYHLANGLGGRKIEYHGIDVIALISHFSVENILKQCQQLHQALSQTLPSSANNSLLDSIGFDCRYQDRFLFSQYLGQVLPIQPNTALPETPPEFFSPFSLMPGKRPIVSVPLHWVELETQKGHPVYWTWQKVLEDLENRRLAWANFFKTPE